MAGGGPADETGWDVRIEWERLLGRDRWVGVSWPLEYGGRGAGVFGCGFGQRIQRGDRA